MQDISFKEEVFMRNKILVVLAAGLSGALLVSSAAVTAGEKASAKGKQIAQAETETGQSGTGVRGTTGETSGGGQTAPGSVGTAPEGGSGATGTEGQPRGNGGAAAGQGGDTGAGGATTLGQPPGGSENHIQEALKHAEAAAAAGKKGDASTIATHAQASKTHAEAALQQKPGDEHLKAALQSLDEAIKEANVSRADKARKSAHEAVTHLKAAK
jgi:hypothetical protein